MVIKCVCTVDICFSILILCNSVVTGRGYLA